MVWFLIVFQVIDSNSREIAWIHEVLYVFFFFIIVKRMAPGLRISRISSGSARGLSAEEFVEPVSEIGR